MKHAKKSKFGVKHLLLIVSLILILAVGTTATLAFLADSDSLTNTFTPAHVTCTVTESFNGTAKSDVKVTNTGDTDAYIRVAVVANWVKDGSVVAPAGITLEPVNGWFSDGNYYYYPAVVAPNGGQTKALFSGAITAPTAPVNGAKLQVDILAEAIQATPKSAVEAAWGGTVANQLADVSEGGSN